MVRNVNSKSVSEEPERVDRRRIGPATKAKLERVAAQQFDSLGFRNTTMKSIAEECGLTPSAFYNHYPSKHDMLFSIISSAYDRLSVSVAEALASGSDPIERLRGAIRAMSKWLLNNPCEGRVSRGELHELDDDSRARLTARWRKFRRTLENVILDGIASGQIKTPGKRTAEMPKVFATAIVSMVEALTQAYPDAGLEGPEQKDEKATELLMGLTDRLLGVEPKG
jgi:AcrR family transcriptional regulator